MEITISGEDKKLLRQVEDIATKLGLNISRKGIVEDKKHKAAIEALEALGKINAFKDVDAPVAWQGEQRKDRPFPRREK